MIKFRTYGGNASGSILRTGFGILVLAILLLTGLANAQGAMYPEAKLIVLSKDSNVSATFEGSDALFNNSFGLWSPRYQELFWGHSTSPNTTFDLGYFPSYTELIFFINNSQNTFLSGPGNRNPDGVVHAAITEIDSQTWRVGFEDTLGGGDHDYNDITVLVKGGLYVIPPNPQKPDFLVLPEDITFSNNNPTEGDIVEIQAKVHNLGNSTDSNITLGFYDGDPDNGGQLISTTTINGIGQEENVTKTIQWDTTGKAGTHNIYVKVDPENLIDEAREDNNKANKEIIVAPAPTPIPTPTFNISGFKINGTDNNGAGIPNWNIDLSNARGAQIASTTTDSTGFYLFSNLTNDTYTVNEVMKPNWTNISSTSQTVKISGADINNVNFTNALIPPPPIPQPPPTPPPTFSITGTVFIDSNQDGVQDNGEQGYSGAKVTLTTGQSVTTDAKGNYIFSNLQGGTFYVVALTVPDGYKATTQNSVNIELNKNTIQNFGIVQTTITPPQPIPSSGSISGYKIDAATGMGIPNWKIKLQLIIGNIITTRLPVAETTTNDQGFYKFDNLPAGRYILTEEQVYPYVPKTSVITVTLAQGEDSKNNNFTNSNLLEEIVPPTLTPLPTTRCSGAPFIFPVPSIDNSRKNSFIGWLYKESTEDPTGNNFIDGKYWIDKSEYHSGLDFYAAAGTRVMAVANKGTVTRRSWSDSEQSWKIDIYYPDIPNPKGGKGVEVFTNNLVDGKTKVPEIGSSVKVGDPIGYVGSYGARRYDTPHIHWSVGPKDYDDQAKIPYPTFNAIQLDPTSFLTPKGNLDYSAEARENDRASLSWWCTARQGK